ncbi:MAG: class I SAM-dependent methyltransferase [Chloroflexi bacterium]|nr:class I SAM-dependent methyltransferase [Chloroflexota bacterium]
MDTDVIKRLNTLWANMYPYLARQAMAAFGRDSGPVLEMGPFSGGISRELARGWPGLEITIADESPAVLAYLRHEIETSGMSRRITVMETRLDDLDLPAGQFDLVVFRGAFFFLDEQGELFKEVFRVLREGGAGFIGGGYGEGVPRSLIDEISEESRELNARLGRKWFSIAELTGVIENSGLAGRCSLQQEGGVWVVLRK